MKGGPVGSPTDVSHLGVTAAYGGATHASPRRLPWRAAAAADVAPAENKECVNVKVELKVRHLPARSPPPPRRPLKPAGTPKGLWVNVARPPSFAASKPSGMFCSWRLRFLLFGSIFQSDGTGMGCSHFPIRAPRRCDLVGRAGPVGTPLARAAASVVRVDVTGAISARC